VLVDVVAFVPF
jgi:hypothetical protein